MPTFFEHRPDARGLAFCLLMTPSRFLPLVTGFLCTLSPLWCQELLRHIEGRADEFGFGNAVLALGDVDGDSIADFAVAVSISDSYVDDIDIPLERPNAWVVFSGASGERLYQIDVPFKEFKGNIFSWEAARLGDINGDGSADFVVGIPNTEQSQGEVGLLRIYNGADGSLIREHSEDLAGQQIGGSLLGDKVAGFGDLDNDGAYEYGSITGGAGGSTSAFTRRVKVFSGASGEELASLQAGGELSIDGPFPLYRDADGDGIQDFLVEQEQSGVGREAVIVSGAVRGDITLSEANHHVLNVLPFGTINYYWPFSTSPAADVDADGTPDLLVNLAEENTVAVISGRTGATLHVGPPGEGSDRYSRSPLGVGDIDGDGHEDIAYGLSTWRAPLLDEVHMSVYSGRTFEPILRVVPTIPVTRSYSEVVDVLDDINGDGYPELLIGVGRRVSRSHPADFRGYVDIVSLVPPRGPIPNLHNIKRVESSNPFLQRWQLDWFSNPGRSYNVELSEDLETWYPGALQEPVRTLGSTGRAFVEVPSTWDAGYFRVRDVTP